MSASLDMLPQWAIDKIIEVADQQKPNLGPAPITLDTEMCACMDAGRCGDPQECGSWNTCIRPYKHPALIEPGDPHPHERIATGALALLHEAETTLIGRDIITTAGIRCRITAVRLNSEHGLTYAVEGNGFAPASTIRDFA